MVQNMMKEEVFLKVSSLGYVCHTLAVIRVVLFDCMCTHVSSCCTFRFYVATVCTTVFFLRFGGSKLSIKLDCFFGCLDS